MVYEYVKSAINDSLIFITNTVATTLEDNVDAHILSLSSLKIGESCADLHNAILDRVETLDYAPYFKPDVRYEQLATDPTLVYTIKEILLTLKNVSEFFREIEALDTKTAYYYDAFKVLSTRFIPLYERLKTLNHSMIDIEWLLTPLITPVLQEWTSLSNQFSRITTVVSAVKTENEFFMALLSSSKKTGLGLLSHGIVLTPYFLKEVTELLERGDIKIDFDPLDQSITEASECFLEEFKGVYAKPSFLARANSWRKLMSLTLRTVTDIVGRGAPLTHALVKQAEVALDSLHYQLLPSYQAVLESIEEDLGLKSGVLVDPFLESTMLYFEQLATSVSHLKVYSQGISDYQQFIDKPVTGYLVSRVVQSSGQAAHIGAAASGSLLDERYNKTVQTLRVVRCASYEVLSNKRRDFLAVDDFFMDLKLEYVSSTHDALEHFSDPFKDSLLQQYRVVQPYFAKRFPDIDVVLVDVLQNTPRSSLSIKRILDCEARVKLQVSHEQAEARFKRQKVMERGINNDNDLHDQIKALIEHLNKIPDLPITPLYPQYDLFNRIKEARLSEIITQFEQNTLLPWLNTQLTPKTWRAIEGDYPAPIQFSDTDDVMFYKKLRHAITSLKSSLLKLEAVKDNESSFSLYYNDIRYMKDVLLPLIRDGLRAYSDILSLSKSSMMGDLINELLISCRLLDDYFPILKWMPFSTVDALDPAIGQETDKPYLTLNDIVIWLADYSIRLTAQHAALKQSDGMISDDDWHQESLRITDQFFLDLEQQWAALLPKKSSSPTSLQERKTLSDAMKLSTLFGSRDSQSESGSDSDSLGSAGSQSGFLKNIISGSFGSNPPSPTTDSTLTMIKNMPLNANGVTIFLEKYNGNIGDVIANLLCILENIGEFIQNESQDKSDVLRAKIEQLRVLVLSACYASLDDIEFTSGFKIGALSRHYGLETQMNALFDGIKATLSHAKSERRVLPEVFLWRIRKERETRRLERLIQQKEQLNASDMAQSAQVARQFTSLNTLKSQLLLNKKKPVLPNSEEWNTFMQAYDELEPILMAIDDNRYYKAGFLFNRRRSYHFVAAIDAILDCEDKMEDYYLGRLIRCTTKIAECRHRIEFLNREQRVVEEREAIKNAIHQITHLTYEPLLGEYASVFTHVLTEKILAFIDSQEGVLTTLTHPLTTHNETAFQALLMPVIETFDLQRDTSMHVLKSILTHINQVTLACQAELAETISELRKEKLHYTVHLKIQGQSLELNRIYLEQRDGAIWYSVRDHLAVYEGQLPDELLKTLSIHLTLDEGLTAEVIDAQFRPKLKDMLSFLSKHHPVYEKNPCLLEKMRYLILSNPVNQKDHLISEILNAPTSVNDESEFYKKLHQKYVVSERITRAFQQKGDTLDTLIKCYCVLHSLEKQEDNKLNKVSNHMMSIACLKSCLIPDGEHSTQDRLQAFKTELTKQITALSVIELGGVQETRLLTLFSHKKISFLSQLKGLLETVSLQDSNPSCRFKSAVKHVINEQKNSRGESHRDDERLDSMSSVKPNKG